MSTSPPRSIVLTRYAFAGAGTLGLAYVALGLVELDHIRAGYVAATHFVGADEVRRVVDLIREFTRITIAIGAVAAATMLPFAIFIRRVGDRARLAMVAVCALLGLAALLVTMSDASTLLSGDVFRAVGLVTEDDAARASALIITAWFPVLHYGTTMGILAACAVGAIALPGAAAREYVRRHEEVAPDDPRIWTLPKRD